MAGAGTMGRGIAQVLAQCGARTLVFDAQPGAARKAKESIAQALGKLVEKGRLSAGDARPPSAASRSVERSKPCAVPASWSKPSSRTSAKRELFSSLEEIVQQDCILASNTSSLSVTAMAAACKRPRRVAGYHFFNPVPVMKIVEVVDGALTEPWATDALTALARRFGHTPVRCKDSPGFVVNHAGRAYVPEALRVLSEGIADFATIDRILVDAAGFRLGPFGLMDLVGLDVSHAVMKSMYQQYFEEPKYRPSFLAEPRVAAGLLGRKTGRGWYATTRTACPEPSPSPPPRPTCRSRCGRFRAEGAAGRARRRLERQAPRRTLCFVAPLGTDATTARSSGPRSAAHGGGRSAVRIRQAPHADEHSRDRTRRPCSRACPARQRTACRSR